MSLDAQMKHARDRRRAAAEKYRPGKIDVLLVAEAPPAAPDRYFYFENVASHDWLFLGVAEAMFGRRVSRPEKPWALSELQRMGAWLIDLKLDPVDGSPLELDVPDLVSRCQALEPERIILIKTTVYDAAFVQLVRSGLPVVDARIPFPARGHQNTFRRMFREALGPAWGDPA